MSKKKFLFSFIALIVLIAAVFVVFKMVKKPTPAKTGEIPLSKEYVNTDGKQIEVSKLTEDVGGYLDTLMNEKKNFVVYVSLPICTGDAAAFKEYVLDFQKNNKISFLYLTSDYVKDTSIYETVKYFPSVIIYHHGKIAKYLRYDSDEDIEYYKSYDSFSNWINSYIKY